MTAMTALIQQPWVHDAIARPKSALLTFVWPLARLHTRSIRYPSPYDVPQVHGRPQNSSHSACLSELTLSGGAFTNKLPGWCNLGTRASLATDGSSVSSDRHLLATDSFTAAVHQCLNSSAAFA